MGKLVVMIVLGAAQCCSSGPVGARGRCERGRYPIRVSDGDRGGYGTFCPPGQARRGRC